MKKIILLLLSLLFIFQINLFSFDKNFIILEAKLFPKIILLDKNIKNKTKNSNIIIHIIYDEKNRDNAFLFHKLVNNKKIHNYTIKAKLSKTISKDIPTAYVLALQEDKSQKIYKNIKNKNRLILALKPENIKNSMVSIHIGTKIYPILNPKLIKESKIALNPVIYKVAKFYE